MKTSHSLTSLIGILCILLTSCNLPVATPLSLPPIIPPSLWIAPYVPWQLARSVVLPGDWNRSDTAESATARLEISDQNILSRWVYALVTPYPTIIDDVTGQDVKAAWQGTPPATFGSRLLIDQDTLDIFTTWWGNPADSAVTVLPTDQLVTTAWDDMTSWAIIPFDQIEPRGAFYAFPKISASGMDDEAFAEKLLHEEHVAVVPGNAFGKGGQGFVRCSYATAYEKIEEALHRMEKFMNRYG